MLYWFFSLDHATLYFLGECAVLVAVIIVALAITYRKGRRERIKEAEEKQRQIEQMREAFAEAYDNDSEAALPILKDVGVWAFNTLQHGTVIGLPLYFFEGGNPSVLAWVLVTLINGLRDDWKTEGCFRLAVHLSRLARADPDLALGIAVICADDREISVQLSKALQEIWQRRNNVP